MECNFCRRCGSKLTPKGPNSFVCENAHNIYRNPLPCVGGFILSEDKKSVTLSVRGIEPRKGMLDSFGGFVDPSDASFESALTRELEEELGIKPDDYSEPQYITSAYGDYPLDNENLVILGCLYWLTLKPGVTLTPQDDVADIITLPLHEVDTDKVHNADVIVGLKELQKMFPSMK